MMVHGMNSRFYRINSVDALYLDNKHLFRSLAEQYAKGGELCDAAAFYVEDDFFCSLSRQASLVFA